MLPYFKNCSRPATATEAALTVIAAILTASSVVVALVAAALIRQFSASRRSSVWLLLWLLYSGDFCDASCIDVTLVAAAVIRRFSTTRRALIWLLLWLFVAVVASSRMERFLDASGFLVAPVVAGHHHVPLSWDLLL